MLNSWLHGRLKDIFGRVKISNENVRHRLGERKGGGVKILRSGENYRVCCPFCGDTRYRLSLPYTCGMKMRMEDGNEVTFARLAHCFNETHCMESKAKREDLFSSIFDGSPPLLFRRSSGTEASRKEVVYPSTLVRLTELRPGHPAVQYLAERGFSTEDLDRFGCSYCPEDPDPLITGRLFIPILDPGGDLIGGQCRSLFDTGSKFPPKYYTLPGTRLSSTLFGLSQADDRMIVVTEGVFDAMRLRPCGVCTFGARISPQQQSLLKTRKAVIFAFDPDLEEKDARAHETYLEVIKDLREEVDTVRELKLPAGKDPADMREEELWWKIAHLMQSR